MIIMLLCPVGLYNLKEFNGSSPHRILLFGMNLETKTSMLTIYHGPYTRIGE